MNLLKSHLLIHVDCTKMKYEFRKELFMASRDRLKDGVETRELRSFLAKKLAASDSRLSEIIKRRKDSIAIEGGDTSEILKSFTKNLPLNSELLKLLNQTFKLDLKKDKSQKEEKGVLEKKKKDHEEVPFIPQRFPTKFKLKSKHDGEHEVIKVPLGGEKTIKFESDVENHYFDRVEEPGELLIALLNTAPNEKGGGDQPGKPKGIEDVFNVTSSSPNKGIIKITLNPKEKVRVGEAYQTKVTLTNQGGEDFDAVFWVKISEPEKQKEDKPKEKENEPDLLGLPEYILASNEPKDGYVTWKQVEDATGEQMDIFTVIFPLVSGENLEKIYINMDSRVLKSFKSKTKNPNAEQLALAERKYISSVYFHTLFLYSITKNRKYRISQVKEDNREDSVDLETYLKDLFESYYSEFILNFGGAEELMQGLGD
jgi:hypothetical protein